MSWITIVLFLTIISATLNVKENHATDNQPTCLPFKALIVWHTYSEDDHSFLQQKRLITKLILEGFPEGTDISLVTVGAKTITKLHFKKKVSDESWIHKLDVPRKSEKPGIPYLELSNAVYNHFDKDEKPKMAEEIFLIVDNKSVIYENLKAVEVLDRKKTYVIRYGKQTSGDVLTNLATDSRHVIGLGRSFDSIDDAAKSILNLSCQDAKLVCDTDKYWAGNRCYRCTYVCSTEAWIPSEYCHNVCPYYKHTPPEKDPKVDHSTPPDNDPEVDHSIDDYSKIAAEHSVMNTYILIIIFIILIIVILVLICCWKGTLLKDKMLHLCGHKNTLKRTECSPIKYKTSDAVHEEDNAFLEKGNANEEKKNARIADSVEAKSEGRIPDTEQKEQLKTDFKHLLKDTPSVCSQSRWDGVKADLEQDHRYQAVPTGSKRENWFDEYVQNLVHLNTGENRRIDEGPYTDRSYVDVARRINNTLPPPNREQGYLPETLDLLGQQSCDDKEARITH